ncbi:MAG: TatD family hydrolase [Firmicutes bacterium]|jgi:TatD DNase family protein|uniref:TatD family deoxyribonuclease n=1 Tax=Sulfobacillus benefaciens TaxID=453960 RepID=A0A2T2X8P0_9FIRM|nr:TatD family hydrolase [Bacillota bacterium]MCL5014259.1 TatD family hydrolase [Bacillota bacterium]PSR30860.1 MAG: TatD family deoxyribonuclease [Sulfobacillus benefaciens]
MNLMGFDSHCHLQDPAFDADREEVYDRAHTQELGILVPGYDMASSDRAVKMAQSHEAVWALVGCHPHEARTFSDTDQEQLRQWANNDWVVGIGEIGLDYHYMNSPMEIQRKVFRDQLELARDMNLPVSVHSREAEDDTWAILREFPGIRGVLHCFTGSREFAEKLLDLGLYLSFAGPVSFKNAHDLRAIVAWAPMDRILVETDSPYLSPVPWRGRRNEPLRVIRVAEVIAAQKNCSTKQVFDDTTSNIIRVFRV